MHDKISLVAVAVLIVLMSVFLVSHGEDPVATRMRKAAVMVAENAGYERAVIDERASLRATAACANMPTATRQVRLLAATPDGSPRALYLCGDDNFATSMLFRFVMLEEGNERLVPF